MKKNILYLSVFCVCSVLFAYQPNQHALAQKYLEQRGEVYFRFQMESTFEQDIPALNDRISIDKIEYPHVYAYANKAGFEAFLGYDYTYEVLTPCSMAGSAAMSGYEEYLKNSGKADWYTYPTYGAYEAILKKFETDFPELCKVYALGKSGMGTHTVYAVRVSNKVAQPNGKPRFLQTATVHGDEVVCYVHTLHMIDTLLASYGTDKRISRLLDSIDFWFLPLYNPDATYKGGDSTVKGAQRANVADGFDLNRNVPCPCQGHNGNWKYGLYTKWAEETKAMLSLHERYRFNLALKFHGGAEMILWPWCFNSKKVGDEDWYKWSSKLFADQVHTDCNNNGYLTGSGQAFSCCYIDALYESHGTEMDYCAYFQHCKSIVLEGSITKILNEGKLRDIWMWLKEAMFRHYELLFTGVQGVVLDSTTQKPLYGVKVTRDGDIDSAEVYTDSAGAYYRFTNKGTFQLTFSCPNYTSKTIGDITVNDYQKKYSLNVLLNPVVMYNQNSIARPNSEISILQSHKNIRITLNKIPGADNRIGIYAINGKLIKELYAGSSSPATIFWDKKDTRGYPVSNGCYMLKLTTSSRCYFFRIVSGL